MYSLQYGTLPIVRATGGLADTVVDLDDKPKTGNGFVFTAYSAEDMVKAVKRAVAAFQNKPVWTAAMQRAMQSDFSWSSSANRYIELYKSLFKKK
jgi:starch synthase